MPVNGRLGERFRSTAESFVLIADGSVAEGLAGVREGVRLAQEMHAQFYLGMLALTLLKLVGPDHPEAQAIGREALANFERNQNRAMAGHLRAALQLPPQTPAARPVEETATARA